jgi:aminoglycoside phosphotransferase (APT) family kinase protein
MEVAARHAFDLPALERWLGAHLPGFLGPTQVTQFSDGQSNPTFHLATPGGAWVLRKKPPGVLLPSAHAIEREYRVLRALGAAAAPGVPVPPVRVACDDPSVIGTPFYVMDYVPGRIFLDPLLPSVPREERAAVYLGQMDALARLHGFDWRRGGLQDYGKPEQYAARQIARWSKQYDASRTEDFQPMEEVRAWLTAHTPPDDGLATVAHGDFRLGNLIYAPARPEVAAILDWELSTIGHPLSDLAYCCMGYHLPPGDATTIGLMGLDLAALGLPVEGALLERYATLTGIDPSGQFRFFAAFSLFRMAAIQQGVYARSLQGNASSPFASRFKDSWKLFAGQALETARGALP